MDRLQLVVEMADILFAGLGRLFTVVTNEKVPDGLAERRRLDVHIGLRFDREVQGDKVREPRLTWRDPYQKFHRTLFGGAFDRVCRRGGRVRILAAE